MKRILVVNNDIDTMELLKSWLERKKYKAEFTGDEDKVMQLVKSFEPDLILIDVLKEMVATKIKSSEKFKNIPVIMMTGYTIPEQKISKELVDDIIEKPFDPQVLDKKIQECLKKQGNYLYSYCMLPKSLLSLE